MSKREYKYQTKAVRVLGYRHNGKLKRLLRKGWEITSSASVGMSGVTVYSLRRLHPKHPEAQG